MFVVLFYLVNPVTVATVIKVHEKKKPMKNKYYGSTTEQR